ncbi:MAG: F0F1 ATP synthase subunit delta [Anaerolineales bacterium]
MELIPNLTTTLFEIVNFLVLTYLLYRFLFKPMMRRVKERAAEKEQLLRQMQRDHDEAARLRGKLEFRLQNVEEEAAEIINEAEAHAEQERAALIEEAQSEVERILAEAQVDAYRLRHQAVDAFHDELVQAIVDVSSLVIGQVAPEELQDELISKLNNRIWELGRSEMERVDELRRTLGARTPTVVVHSASELSPEQQGQLMRTFSALADRNVNLDLNVDPSLGLGLRVRIGDLMVDNTIAGQLDEIRAEVSASLADQVIRAEAVEELEEKMTRG